MALVYSSGAETGDFSEFVTHVAGTSVDNTVARSGTYSYKSTISAGAGSTIVNTLNLSRGRFRTFFRFDTDSNPTTFWSPTFGIIQTAASAAIAQLNFALVSGQLFLQIFDSVFSLVYNSATSIVKNTWYCIEWDLKIGAGTGTLSVYIDGVLITALTLQQFGATNIGIWQGLYTATDAVDTRNWWMDDLAVDDATWSPTNEISLTSPILRPPVMIAY